MTSDKTLLCLSTWPFPWGWYGDVRVLSIFSNLHVSRINWLPKFFPWSVYKTSGTPNFKTHFSTIARATSSDSVPTRGVLTTNFVNISVITKICFAFEPLAIVTGPKISAATLWNRIPTLNGWWPATRFRPAVVLAAQRRHHNNRFSISNLIDGHQNLCLTRLSVFSNAKWPPLTGESCSCSIISLRPLAGTINCRTVPPRKHSRSWTTYDIVFRS